MRGVPVSRLFIQHHIVVLDEGEHGHTPSAVRRRLYSGPGEIELLNMLLEGDELTASEEDAHVDGVEATSESDESSDASKESQHTEESTSLSLATLSGARGIITASRNALRIGVELDDRHGGEKRYQTVRLLREGKVAIGRGVLLHVVVVSAPLQYRGAAWARSTADDARIEIETVAAGTDVSRLTAMTPDELEHVRNSLIKPIEQVRTSFASVALNIVVLQLVKRTKKSSPSAASLPAPPGAGADDDDDNVNDADLGIVGNAAWRELPQVC